MNQKQIKETASAANSGTSECAGSVYEVVDASSEETYWTCGIFPTLETAIAAVEECNDPHDIGGDNSGFNDNYAMVEVRERKFGWSGTGKVRYVREWERAYDESSDDYSWKKKPNAPDHRREKEGETHE